MIRKTKTDRAVDALGASQPRAPTKLALLLAELGRADGASIAELTAATGWQPHSVRGTIAGTLKKRGHTAMSDVVDGVRRYRLIGAAQ